MKGYASSKCIGWNFCEKNLKDNAKSIDLWPHSSSLNQIESIAQNFFTIPKMCFGAFLNLCDGFDGTHEALNLKSQLRNNSPWFCHQARGEML